MASLITKFQSLFKPGEQEELDVVAVPGLVSLLDVALYRAFEGQLTATVTSSHNLLAAWLDLKRQSVKVLRCLQEQECVSLRSMENFARTCLDAACDAIERLTTDPFAQTANFSDPYEPPSITGQHHDSLLAAVQGSARDTGRRAPLAQNGKDCWESSRLFCPDYVWADDAAQHCQRLLRQLLKNPFFVESLEKNVGLDTASRQVENATADREASVLLLVVQADLPARLVQFRASIEADSVVSKRLYLVKCEYRAPFRAFLEGHQALQKAPSLQLVDEYLHLPKSKIEQRREAAKERLQNLLANPELIEALALEKKCEEFEVNMAKALYSFSDLARYLDLKRARLQPVKGVLTERELVPLRETLRRLKGVLCRKAGPDTSTGIRPILLDLQGVARDDETSSSYFTTKHDDAWRLNMFIGHLQALRKLCQTRNAFRAEKRSEVDVPSSIKQGCKEFDHELFSCHYQDWLAMVKRQHELTNTKIDRLAEKLRRAEMQTSLAAANNQSLNVVRKRLEMIASDREKRFQVLEEMVEEVCLREMNLLVKLSAPDKSKILALESTTSPGIFGLQLEMAGEPLPP